MSDAEQSERRQRTWLLIEKVSIEKGKEGLRFIEIASDSRTIEGGKERIFGAKSFKLAYVGNIYTIEATETACWPDTLRYVSKWHNEQEIVQWQAKARVFDVQRRMTKMAKEASRPDELRAALEPLRLIYRQTDATGRVALEAMVPYFLRYGSTPFTRNGD